MIRTTLEHRQPVSAVAATDPIVLCTADDRYAMPLAVTLFSAAESLDRESSLRVYLVDNGMRPHSLQMLKETLAGTRISMERIPASDMQIGDLCISHHISHAAYLRLFADRWLPEDVDKVIYLDSDLVVRTSLTELWNYELGDRYLLAAPDIACPFIDPKSAKSNFRRSSPYMAVLEPIRNYRQFGLRGDEHYFNSGVMVLNLKRWRAECLGQQLLDCLRDNQPYVWCWDQYALNVVLGGNWGRLPMRWNMGSHTFEYPSRNHAPVDPDDFVQMLTDPAIIHFTTEFKPWDYYCSHPWRSIFFDYLDRTAWKSWRPEKPKFSLRRWWQNLSVYWTKQFTISYRKLAAARQARSASK